jgi:hypothetical protein
MARARRSFRPAQPRLAEPRSPSGSYRLATSLRLC